MSGNCQKVFGDNFQSPEKKFSATDVLQGDGGADGSDEPAGPDYDGAPVGVDGGSGLLEDGDDVHCLALKINQDEVQLGRQKDDSIFSHSRTFFSLKKFCIYRVRPQNTLQEMEGN